jgi:hypothetical protein
MQKYSVSAPRLRTTPAAPTANNRTEQKETTSCSWALKLKKLGKCFNDPERRSRATKSNKMKSQERAVLNMAFGYAMAWFLVWTPYFVLSVILVASNFDFVSDTLVVFSDSQTPLQGFFNFIVFMAPKVRTTGNDGNAPGWITRSIENNDQSHQHLTWCQALYKAYMSRGLEEDRNLRSSNRIERRSIRSIARETNGSVRSIFGRMKPFAKSSIGTQSREQRGVCRKWKVCCCLTIIE